MAKTNARTRAELAPRGSSPRERLLRAAELFYAEGLHSVGINRLLEEAGTPVMSLYRNFGSKDGLVQEFLQGKGERVRDMFQREAEARADTGRGRILAVFDVLAEVFADEAFCGCAFINVAVEVKREDDPLRASALRHKDWTRGLFRRFAVDMGAVDPDRLATRLTMIMDGAFVTADLRRDDSSVGAEARMLAEIVLDATVSA